MGRDEKIVYIVLQALLIWMVILLMWWVWDAITQVPDRAPSVVHQLEIIEKAESGLFANWYFVLKCNAGRFGWRVTRDDYYRYAVGDYYPLEPWTYDIKRLGPCSGELTAEYQRMRTP